MSGAQALPVIDISPLGSGADDPATVRAIDRACRDTGFFLCTGHGVDPGRTARLYALARAFFDLAEDDKRRWGQGTEVPGGLSFAPMLQEALGATTGAPAPADLKESLNYGPRLPGGNWPPLPDGLRRAFEEYFAEMEGLAQRLRRAFCAAIGLAPDHLEPAFVGHTSALRVINYPAQTVPPEPGQLRAGAHTDYGFITILRSEATPGGLQVQSRDGGWHDVPAVEGAYVINIADALMRWTNDEWVSTPHRVANPPPEAGGMARRQSIPFFVNPASDATIACLPPFVGGGAKYEPISFGDYIALKTRQAFGG